MRGPIVRVETGVPGLDKLVNGGFVKNSIILLSGASGTGKTIFGSQFIWRGLLKGENGIYLSFEEPSEDILTSAYQLGMDFEKYIRAKRCAFEYIPPHSLDEVDFEIFKRIERIQAKRLVIDSLTILSLATKSDDEAKMRGRMFDILQKIKKSGVTSLVISEVLEGQQGVSRFGFEEFIADGVIQLHYLEYSIGGVPRSMIIRKMRNTKHGLDIYPFEITERGIALKAR